MSNIIPFPKRPRPTGPMARPDYREAQREINRVRSERLEDMCGVKRD